MKAQLLATAVVILGAIASPLKAAADAPKYPSAMIREWRNEFREMVIDNYTRLILPELTLHEARRLRGVNWAFPEDSARVLFEFESHADATIVLPVASLLFLKDLANAEAWLTVKGYSSQPIFDYLGLIRMGRLKSLSGREQLPLGALGIPPDATDDRRVLERRNDILSKSILFIIGHELGHIVHGFGEHARCQKARDGARPLGCNLERVRKEEAKADQFSLELFRRIGLVPSASNFIFAVSSRLQKSALEFDSVHEWQAYLRTLEHPVDSARIAASAAFLEANGMVFASAARTGGDAAIAAVVRKLKELAQLLDDRDLNALQLAWAKTLVGEDLKPRESHVPMLRPRASLVASTGPFQGYYRGELHTKNNAHRQPLEVIFRSSPSRVSGEFMLMGIRGRLEGRLDITRRALLTMDIAGDLYEVKLETDTAGTVVGGTYASQTDSAARGRIELTRTTSMK